MKRLLNELRRSDHSSRLFPAGSSVLVALSGGPDSVCLTLLLKAYRRARGLRLAAAHVNHGLRPSSGADARWVEGFCRANGLECHILRVNVKRRIKTESESVEEAARRERYQVLTDLALRQKFDTLATAHTADDQAETVLMRLAAGTGIWGLAAIPAIRHERGIRIVRPLLGVSKKDLLTDLRRAKVRFRVDKSNTASRFLRNRVRNELLPRLARRLNPRIAEHLSAVASDAFAWRTWAERQAEEFLRRSVRSKGCSAAVSETSLLALPEPLRAPVYFKICETLTGREQHLRREHIRQIEDLLAAAGPVDRRLAVGLCVRRIPARTGAEIIWSVDPS